MSRRLKLQEKLEELLENRNVYYQPPDTIKINYPAIIYNKQTIDKRSADDTAYTLTDCYELIVINKLPNDELVNKLLLTFAMVSHDRHYASDGLNHDVLTLYY